MAMTIPTFWKVILGRAWDLGRNGLEPDLFMILRRDGSNDRVSEDGTNTANDTTNRLKVEISQDDDSYEWDGVIYPQYTWYENWYASVSNAWVPVSNYLSYYADHEYTDHEFWQYFYDYADFYNLVSYGFTSSSFYETYYNINYNPDFFSTRTTMPNKAYYKLNTLSIVDRSTSDTPITLTIKNVGVANGSVSLSSDQSWIEFYVGSDSPTATLDNVSISVGATLTVNVLIKAGTMPDGFDLANITITDVSADNTPITVQVIQGRNVHSTYRLLSAKSPKVESNYWDYGSTWSAESPVPRGPYVVGPYDDALVNLGADHGDMAFWSVIRLPTPNTAAIVVAIPTHNPSYLGPSFGGNYGTAASAGSTCESPLCLGVNIGTSGPYGYAGQQANWVSILNAGYNIENGYVDIKRLWYVPEINDGKPHTIGLYIDRHTAWRRVPDGTYEDPNCDGYSHAALFRLFIDGVERLPSSTTGVSPPDATTYYGANGGPRYPVISVVGSVAYETTRTQMSPLTAIFKSSVSRPGTLWTDHMPIAAFWGTLNTAQVGVNAAESGFAGAWTNWHRPIISFINPIEMAWCTVFSHIDRAKVVKGMKYIHDAAKVSETALNTAMTAVGTRVCSYKLTETVTDSVFGTLADASPAENDGRLCRAEDSINASMKCAPDPSDTGWMHLRFNVNGTLVTAGQTELTSLSPRRPGGFPTMIPTGSATMSAPASLLEDGALMRYLPAARFKYTGNVYTDYNVYWFGRPEEPTDPATVQAPDQWPSFPPGDYKITYVGPGCAVNSGSYKIPGHASDSSYFLFDDGGNNIQFADTATTYGSAAAAEEAEAGVTEITFTHAGGKIGMYSSYTGGWSPTTSDARNNRLPVFKLTAVSSGGGGEDDSNTYFLML